MIYGQAVGSFNVAADDHDYVGSVQRGPHNARSLLIPVCPEHQTTVGTNRKQELRAVGAPKTSW